MPSRPEGSRRRSTRQSPSASPCIPRASFGSPSSPSSSGPRSRQKRQVCHLTPTWGTEPPAISLECSAIICNCPKWIHSCESAGNGVRWINLYVLDVTFQCKFGPILPKDWTNKLCQLCCTGLLSWQYSSQQNGLCVSPLGFYWPHSEGNSFNSGIFSNMLSLIPLLCGWQTPSQWRYHVPLLVLIHTEHRHCEATFNGCNCSCFLLIESRQPITNSYKQLQLSLAI